MGGKGATHLARGGGVSVAVSEDFAVTASGVSIPRVPGGDELRF